MGKIKFCSILVGGLLLLMTSCLGGGDSYDIDDWNLGNAQISSFLLSNDSIDGLSEVVFTIDQLNGKIYNKDSMPYGTVIDEKVLCKVAYDGKYDAANILFVQTLTNDSVWGINDSIDFSAPVTITVYPHDGVSTKVYEAKINIHQVNPDTMVWHKYTDLISGKTFKDMRVVLYGNSYYMYVVEEETAGLYKTDITDMVNWKEVSLSGFPAGAVLSQITKVEDDLYAISEQGVLYHSAANQNSDEEQVWSTVENTPLIKALMGYIPKGTATGARASLSAVVVADDDLLRYAAMSVGQEWEFGTEVPETFPLSGFGCFDYETMYFPRLVVASGRDSRGNLSSGAWSTMNGLSWALLSNNRFTFSPREGSAVAYYDNCFFVFGGMDASGNALNDIYYSKDNGITWNNTMYVMPEEYALRGYSSIAVDKNNYILLFGGKAGKDTNVLNELWRGRINRLGFGKE